MWTRTQKCPFFLKGRVYFSIFFFGNTKTSRIFFKRRNFDTLDNTLWKEKFNQAKRTDKSRRKAFPRSVRTLFLLYDCTDTYFYFIPVYIPLFFQFRLRGKSTFSQVNLIKPIGVMFGELSPLLLWKNFRR